MNSKLLLALSFLVLLAGDACNRKGNTLTPEKGAILKVPADFITINEAVKSAADGDWIILAPGHYSEMKIDVDKSVTISSEWKTTGNESKIDETIIDSGDSILFNIIKDGAEISGLRIINGDHPLNITAKTSIKYNHFIDCKDAMSFEGSGGGYSGYNIVENDRDDGIDLDIRLGESNKGSDIMIEHNTIKESHDDGIEIRLYDYENQNIKYEIHDNHIIGSNNAGIQIISYDVFTGKSFMIHHNIIQNCKTGVGCMEGQNSKEDMTGASKMDELVCLFNNTLTDNQMGATGGNKIVAFNNLVFNNVQGGFRRFGEYSVIRNNLFFNNGGKDLLEINDSAMTDSNLFSRDPLVKKVTFEPGSSSPCTDEGLKSLTLENLVNIQITSEYILGKAPDIGAVETIK
jgi:hypothetical protein